MPISEKQRQRRTRYIGSSDAPVILGQSPYKRTAVDTYYSKVSPLPEDELSADYIRTGNYIEDALIQFFVDKTGKKVLKNQWRVAKHGRGKGVFASNSDALLVGVPEGLEVKYCNAEYGKEYGDEYTDAIPMHVLIQCQHQAYCSDLERVWVAAGIAGFSLTMKLYCVERDDEIINLMVERCMDWWDAYVKTETPPPGGEVPPIDFLNAIHREPASVIELTDEDEALAGYWEDCKQKEKHWKAVVAMLRTRIIQRLEDKEIGLLPDGRTLDFKEIKTSYFNKKALAINKPELVTQYTEKRSSKKLLLKKAKKVKKGIVTDGKETNSEESKPISKAG